MLGTSSDMIHARPAVEAGGPGRVTTAAENVACNAYLKGQTMLQALGEVGGSGLKAVSMLCNAPQSDGYDP